MIYERLDENGDMVFGQGSNDFLYDIDAVVQAIKTRLSLRKGTFWRDISDGLPLYQQILGKPAGIEALRAIDSVYSNRISGTPGVTRLISYSSSFDSRTRAYSYQTTVETVYSTVSIAGAI